MSTKVAEIGHLRATLYCMSVLDPWPLAGPHTSGFAQPDGAIPGMDGQRLSAAVHLAANLRIAEGSFHGHRDTQANVAIACARVYVRLEVCRQHQVHAAVTRPNRPARCHLGAGLYARIHAAIACYPSDCQP